MCGILGQFSFGALRPDVDRLRAQVNALRHRGPDDGTWWADGPFFFGHRRLSIIDVSHGRQPMASLDGRFVVTYNGEIYNYLELREELRALGHLFHTESDTEILLHGYREWGTGMPERLKGMFAFGLADRLKQELFLSRDRFGEKPLLAVERSEGITFASEMRPLAALPMVPRELDIEGLAGYLSLNYVPGDRTLLQAVRRVEPGSWRLYGQGGRAASGLYWSPHADAAHVADNLTEPEALDRLERLLDRAVGIALRSDVPVGVFLSSGIDSSLVSYSAVRAGRLSRAYCLTVSEKSYTEWEGARATADRLGIPITPVVLDASALDHFLSIVEHADDPLADSSALAVDTLAREASKHNKVVIGGDGGDELFGGYLTYRATLWHERTISRLPMPLRRALAGLGGRLPTRETKVSTSYKAWRFLRASALPSNVAHFTWNGTWLPAEAAGFLRDDRAKGLARTCLAQLADRHRLPERPTLLELQRADVAEYLPNDILAKSDRINMAHGLEVRSPFLEPELASFALALPARFKAGATGPLKRVLRQLARRTYGAQLASAKKQGFSIPVHTWLRGPARQRMLELLSPESVRAVDALEGAAVQRVVADHLEGRRSYGFELWGLMVLVAWHRARVLAPPATPLDAGLDRIEFPLIAGGAR